MTGYLVQASSHHTEHEIQWLSGTDVFTQERRIIAFSGPDGSGKSTQIDLLKKELERRGFEPVVLWTRLGYTPGFEKAKALLRATMGRKLPGRGASPKRDAMMGRASVRTLWLAGAIADLLFTAAIRVRLETFRGRPVICDRWVWDSFIDRRLYHQGAPWIDAIIGPLFKALGAKPQLAFLLNLPYEEAKRRSEKKEEPFPDAPEVRAARHAEYEAMAADPRFVVLDATRPPEVIAAEIAALL